MTKEFAAFLGRSPDTASFEDVRRFQLHLAANGAHIPIVNHTVVPVGNLILLATDIESGDAPALCERSVA